MARRREFGSTRKEGTTFSIRWFENGKKGRARGFVTRTAAAARLARPRVEMDDGIRTVGAPVALDVTVDDAITAYGKYLAEDKGNKPGPTADTLYRPKTFFPSLGLPLADLTPDLCKGGTMAPPSEGQPDHEEGLRGRFAPEHAHRGSIAPEVVPAVEALDPHKPAGRCRGRRQTEARQAATSDRRGPAVACQGERAGERRR